MNSIKILRAIQRKYPGMQLTVREPDEIVWPEGMTIPDSITLAMWITEHEQAELIEATAEAARVEAKAQALVDNLPSWVQVSTAVDNISNLADAKVFIKKLARITYWLAKDKAE
jgi:hypothetical protein